MNTPSHVGAACVTVLVPAAVRVVNAAQTVVVPSVAHHQVDLANPIVRCHNQGLVLQQYSLGTVLNQSNENKIYFFQIKFYSR